VRISLAYKIFGVFLLTSLATVALTVGTVRFFAHRNFAAYIDHMEMDKLADLAQVLGSEFQTSGGWGRLQANPELWRRMVRSAGRGMRGWRGMPPEHRPPGDRRERGMSMHGAGPPPGGPHWDMLAVGRRIYLLDAEKRLIAGQRGAADDTVQVLSVGERPIGYLGISSGEPQWTPPEIAFLQRQNKLFYLIGAGIFILTACVSFFLSRHVLSPIRKLAEGTRALASRKLTTRIEVRSRDELGQLAGDFNVMAHTLEQYEEMRKRWISDISHELRTPLAILRGELEAIQDGVRKTDRAALDSLHAEVLHLGKIVDDLHELSLADAGGLRLERKPLDPLEVLRETLSLFATRLEGGRIALDADLADAPGVSLEGDAGRLAQVFSNILENTLRYADTPGSLSVRQRVSGDRLILTFEDSGPGVPEEALGRLFDRLYRVDPARTRGKGGSGLGLAICKAIVEAHGGTIAAANAPGGGLRIQVTLPLSARTGERKSR
jgi:two-component system sensor histidine kinase BaeS